MFCDPEDQMIFYCKRCGEDYSTCPHLATSDSERTIDAARAERIRARYELGKKFDPAGHDTNDYYTENEQK